MFRFSFFRIEHLLGVRIRFLDSALATLELSRAHTLARQHARNANASVSELGIDFPIRAYGNRRTNTPKYPTYVLRLPRKARSTAPFWRLRRIGHIGHFLAGIPTATNSVGAFRWKGTTTGMHCFSS